MKILLTGGAGFIGSAVGRALLSRGDEVVVFDNLNDYYDQSLKEGRVKHLLAEFEPTIVHADIADRAAMEKIFRDRRFDAICHLAAQAGVRYSLKNPFVYAQSNVVGTLTLLELARLNGNPPFIYASSSSVYGANDKVPFSEDDRVDQPISLYAATKRATELLAYTYHHLYQLPCTGLRFFTVYGPWGRPDMSYTLFVRDILAGKEISLFNHGEMERDFTFIDDIVSGVLCALDHPFPCEIFNLGNNQPVTLRAYVTAIEKACDQQAKIKLLPLQPGDLPRTHADIAKANRLLGWQPKTELKDGIQKFVVWYREYHKI